MPRADRSLDALLDLDCVGRRLIGFDNAHSVRRPGGRFVEQVRMYDHVHRGPEDSGRPYRFANPGRLLEDFWGEVDRVLAADKE